MALKLKTYQIKENGIYKGDIQAPNELSACITFHMNMRRGHLSDIMNPEIMNRYRAEEYKTDNTKPLYFPEYGITINQDIDLITSN